MKKVFCLLSLALLCPAAANAAEDAGDFYQNLLVTDEVIAAENEDIAIENAPGNAGLKPKNSKKKRQQGCPPAQPRRRQDAGCGSRTGSGGTGSA